MKILNLEQGSPQWLEWRRTRITATDASVIMGINPYVIAKELWAEKLGLTTPEPPNEHMLRGQRLEPEAREIFIRETGIQVAPAVVEHSKDWWMGASLDGLSTCGGIVLEIKCPSKRNHEFSLECGILEYWQVQMQHQLFVTGAEMCYFMSYNPEFETGRQYILREMFPNFEFMEWMFDLEEGFYNTNMCGMVEPGDVNPLYRTAAG